MTTPRIAARAMMIAVTLPCPAQPAIPSEPLALEVIRGRPILNQVYINDQGPYRFLLDTGAQTNQIAASLARKLGLEASFRVDLDTPAGRTVASGGRIARVAVGSADATNQEFLFTELAGIRDLSPGIQGVIGEEFLAHFDYLLNCDRRRIVFGGAPPVGERIPIRFIDDRPAVDTSAGVLVLDSGTDGVLLRRPAIGVPRRIQTASSFADVEKAKNFKLTIAAREYRLPAVYFLSAMPLTEDGQLPACLFHSLYISSRDEYVILDADQSGKQRNALSFCRH